jgi:hypothetical protein
MCFHAFQHNYHDSEIESFQLGPEEKLTLDVRPRGQDAAASRLRFEGIENYEEVSAFFYGLTTPPSYRGIDEIVGIKKSGKKSWVLDLSNNGSITIHCTRCDEI